MPIRIEADFSVFDQIEQHLPEVFERRLKQSAEKGRDAGRRGVDSPGLPESDTGALREGIVIQTEQGDDYAERRAEALSAFTGNASKYGYKGHTEEDFNRLCAELPPPPESSNQFEMAIAIVVLMKYGLWFEEGDAWDLAKQAKRSPAPWFGPAMNAWGSSEFEENFGGMIEESIGGNTSF